MTLNAFILHNVGKSHFMHEHALSIPHTIKVFQEFSTGHCFVKILLTILDSWIILDKKVENNSIL